MNNVKILEGTQLGLPPMELAETKKMNDEVYSSVKRYFYPILHKIIQIIFILIFAMGFYYIFSRQLLTSDNTEIVFVTKSEASNLTQKAEIEIFVHLKNVTSNYGLIRKRRNINKNESNDVAEDKVLDKFSDEQMIKARDIILKHNKICNKNNQNEVCKNLIMELHAITSDKEIQQENYAKTQDVKDKIQNQHLHDKPFYYINQRKPLPLTETCLLARLLKKYHPLVHDSLHGDIMSSEQNLVDTQHRFAYDNFYAQPKVNTKMQQRKTHPQDYNIFMKLLTPKQETTATGDSQLSSKKSGDCPMGTTPCNSLNSCIDESKWCNGKVDCEDASDELQCDCKSRIHKSRLCDGYFDCPLGDDEIGCYGCNMTSYSCGDIDENMQSTCFGKEQRCNNIVDCPNQKDELDCSMLTPNIQEESVFAVSNLDGYLLRNFRGSWYAVCTNPDMFAEDACQRETGLMIRPPFIQEVPVDPEIPTKYLNLEPSGLISISNTCFNSSAMYVTCPDMMCGTRTLTESQLISENIAIENQQIGRNKRFSARFNYFSHNADILRVRRAESRVVGGKPSQPAAWPWMIALYRDGTFHCGGVILTKNWVMTAGHCVTEFWDHYYEIQVGMLRRFSFSLQEKNHLVTNIVINHNYRPEDMQNDLALLKVKPAIKFGQWVRPVCLPSPITAGSDWLMGPAPGTICTTVGWGAMKEKGPDPDQLREVDIPIYEKCTNQEDIVGDEICAGFVKGGKDACQGDSGGPLLCRNPNHPQQWYMAGIVSHGDGCGRKRKPGVYTRVSLYLKWIKLYLFSQSLPKIRPSQQCPGLKCTSGITKCIPKRRICDKIIDCLNGEDEVDCNYSKMTVFDKLLLPNNNVRSTATDNTIQQNESTNNNSSVGDEETKEGIQNISNAGQKLSNDLNHASTIEISISSSSESEEDTTTEYSVTIKDLHRGDMQTFSQTISAESIESMSSIAVNESSNKLMRIQNPLVTIDSEEITTTPVTKTDIDEVKNTSTTLHISEIENFTENNVFDKIEKNEEQSNKDLQKTEQKKKPDKNQTMTVINFMEGIEERQEVIRKFEEMLYSEIHSPIIRRKHKTPKEFECRRMFQIIPYSERCDHKADCEDGTDEIDCSCTDYISTFDSSFLCDGIFDCRDGQDENECFICKENHFLCPQSKLCIPEKYVCDGTAQCPHEEDESNCFILSNGNEMFFDVESKPQFVLSGYLTKKINNDWHVVCEDQITSKSQGIAANNVCRHLGFSSAKSYGIRYISIKEDNLKRSVRSNNQKIMPVKFVYKTVENDTATFIPIIKTNDIGLECKTIPKTCMALHVECDSTLVIDSKLLKDLSTRRSTDMYRILPWIAKVFVDGSYKCTGVLLDLSWVLVPHSCLWDSLLSLHYITVTLGSHRTQRSNNGPFEQNIEVDMKRDLYRSKVALLHLKDPAIYSAMVKPMDIPLDIQYNEESMCLAIGQDETNKTIAVFVEENNVDCDSHNRCFKRISDSPVCPENMKSKQEWSGIISCHTMQGWYPAASFIDSRGECGVGDSFIATDVGYLKNELKDLPGNVKIDSLRDDCKGIRCARGRCLDLRQLCNGVTECEDGHDESESACHKKERICEHEPFFKGCECATNELKCNNGKCIAKGLFNNGVNDCDDGSDEPGHSTCLNYLSRVMPSRLCDGILHCHDRSDEDPKICKCFAKRFHKCSQSWDDVEYCVSPDVVCDGFQDCPNGDDEKACLAINSPEGAPIGTGEIIVRTHGVWHRKCYPKKIHTRTELEKICRELGFIGGHAKQLDPPAGWIGSMHNSIVVDKFSNIKINDNTTIKLRNTQTPLAKSVFDDTLEECHPVYIECL